MPELYHDRKEVQGSASNQTIKLTKIPAGYQLLVKHFSAGIYTSNPGDYTTTKFIWLGYEQNGITYYLEGYDVQAGTGLNQAVVFVKDFYIPENGVPVAYVEATSTSQKIHVVINGILEKFEK